MPFIFVCFCLSVHPICFEVANHAVGKVLEEAETRRNWGGLLTVYFGHIIRVSWFS